jgi:alkanesulfonate monooxygenase SsuD/methylene tetrahydromethanopterin reductase-like flavin-dependent oxidoreductase (luciferase family)
VGPRRPYGLTIQDQERNRKAFEEAIAVMKKCWTEPSFAHHGEFFSVPPTSTRWNHKQTIAYFQWDEAGRRLAGFGKSRPIGPNIGL